MLAIMLSEGPGSAGGISWMLWAALAFFGLMVLVGWLSSRYQKMGDVDESFVESHKTH